MAKRTWWMESWTEALNSGVFPSYVTHWRTVETVGMFFPLTISRVTIKIKKKTKHCSCKNQQFGGKKKNSWIWASQDRTEKL